MPLYLGLAYGIFCAVPLALAVSLAIRRRRVERAIAALQAQGGDGDTNGPSSPAD